MEDAEIHEIYHIIVRNIAGKSIVQNIEEEIAAELTKFIHTPLGCATLLTNIVRLHRHKQSRAYKTGKWIFKKFIEEIKLRQNNGTPGYENIPILGETELEQISNFYKLTNKQIKEIANEIFFSLA